MSTATVKLPGTPPNWVNETVERLLRVPGLRRVLGRSFAVITVTGARTGRRYSTPVQYLRVGERYLVTSQVQRRWWRNVRTQPHVELLVRGRVVTGSATVAEGDAACGLLADCLARMPQLGKVYGLHPTMDGTFTAADIEMLADHVVVLSIKPDAQ